MTSKKFDWDKHIITTSLKYDDHNPIQRKQMEDHLVRQKIKIPDSKSSIQTRTKPFKVLPKTSTPVDIDFSLPRSIVDQVIDYAPAKVDRKKYKQLVDIDLDQMPTGIAKLLGVKDE